MIFCLSGLVTLRNNTGLSISGGSSTQVNYALQVDEAFFAIVVVDEHLSH